MGDSVFKSVSKSECFLCRDRIERHARLPTVSQILRQHHILRDKVPWRPMQEHVVDFVRNRFVFQDVVYDSGRGFPKPTSTGQGVFVSGRMLI